MEISISKADLKKSRESDVRYKYAFEKASKFVDMLKIESEVTVSKELDDLINGKYIGLKFDKFTVRLSIDSDLHELKDGDYKHFRGMTLLANYINEEYGNFSIVEQMARTILTREYDSFETDKKCLAALYSQTEISIGHPLNIMAERIAQEDYNKIREACSLIKEYEANGIKFDFNNYKTKVN